MLMKIIHRIIVRKGTEHFPVIVDDIVLFYTENRITFAFTKTGTKYIADEILSSLETTLSREKFYRANRQNIVNIDFIKSFRTIEKVKISIELAVPVTKEPIVVSQDSAAAFRQWIEGKLWQ
jgi:DNA-binding LytR/AlgR family response regulator